MDKKQKHNKIDLKVIFIILLVLCVGVIFLEQSIEIIKWKKIKEQEEAKKLPYENDKTYIGDEEFRIKCKIKQDKINFEIIEYIGNNTNVVVPDDFEGYPVIGIADTTFMDNSFIEEVVIEVTNQTEGAIFKNCSELKSVYFSDSVEVLNQNTFDNCPKLESISVTDKCRFSPMIVKDENNENSGKVINIIRRTDTDIYENFMEIQNDIEFKEIQANDGSYIYIYDSHEGIKITDIQDNITGISLPRRINEYNIYKINDIYGLELKVLDVSSCSELEYDFRVKRCEQLVEIRYPESITEIDEYAISDCPNLKKIVVYHGCIVNPIYKEMGIEIEYIN